MAVYPPDLGPSWWGKCDWQSLDKKRNGVHYVGDTVTISLTLPGATSYEVYTWDAPAGEIVLVSSGTITPPQTDVTPTVPSGGWKPGWYRFYAYGPNIDTNYGNSYSSTNFVVIRDNPNFIPMPDNSVAARGTGLGYDIIMKCVMGMGPPRQTVADLLNWTTDSAGYQRRTQQCVDYWTNPVAGPQYIDPVRTRNILTSMGATQTWDELILHGPGGTGQWCLVAAKDGTIDGDNLYVSVGAGSVSGTKVTVYYPDSSTVVETFDNIANGTTSVITALSASSYIFPQSPQQNAQSSGGTMSATVVGATYYKAVQAYAEFIDAIAPDAVYEGPFNEPALNGTWAHRMKMFHDAVIAGAPGATVIGPCPVDIIDTNGWGLFLAAGGADSIDALGFHDYNTFVNSELALPQFQIERFQALVAANGVDLPFWQTEATNTFTNVYGVAHWRHSRILMVMTLLWEQYGITREHNPPWYDLSHGFWDYPSWLESADGSLMPACVMYRVLAEETWAQTHSEALDFGTLGNKVFLGSIYSGTSGSTCVLLTSSAMPVNGIVLSVSGTTDPLTVVDAFGNESEVPILGGKVTIPTCEVPTYVRLPTGVSVSVDSVNDWLTFDHENVAVLGTATLGGVSESSVNDNTWLNDYNNFVHRGSSTHGGGMVRSASNPPDTCVVTLAEARTISRVFIWAGPVTQPASTLLDFDVQTTTDGSTWTTQATITEDDATSFQFGSNSDELGSVRETFWKERSFFDVPISPPAQNVTGVRLNVRATSYGGEPDADAAAVNASYGASDDQHIVLQEVAVVAESKGLSGYVQNLGFAAITGISTTSVTATLTQTMASDNQIVVAVKSSGGTSVTSVTDSHGNTYTKAVEKTTSAPSASLWYCLSPGTPLSAGDTVTATGSSSSASPTIIVEEYHGLTAVDQTTTASGSAGTSVTLTASGANAQADEIAICALSTGGDSGAWTVTGPFIARDDSDPSAKVARYSHVYDQTYTASTTPSASVSWVTSNNYAAVMAVFKVLSPAPVNTAVPTVSGTNKVGQTLTTSDGTWAGSPTISYQWQRDNAGGGVYAPIPSATSSTYTVTGTDALCNIRSVVTATNANNSTKSASVAASIQATSVFASVGSVPF